MRLAYVGDGSNNVATSLMAAAGKVGMSVVVVSPAGYQPDPATVAATDADVTVTDDLDGVVGADVLYTDVWTSMGQEAETDAAPVFRLSAQRRLGGPRAQCGREDHAWSAAHRGEEITDAVADSAGSLLFPQAHNGCAQKALLAHLLGGIPLQYRARVNPGGNEPTIAPADRCRISAVVCTPQ
ncbi:MAG: hypothetical protein R2851_04785 [Caldilineaceae bacterium]